MSTTNGYYPSPIKTRLSDSEPVPKGWRWVELQDVARLESGHTPSRKVAEYWEGGDVPWLSLKDIRGMTSRYVMDTIDKPTMLGIDNSSARVLPKGTVAFCRTASVGNVAILGQDMATSQDFVDWVCGPELLPEFLYEAFKASGPTFANEMQGSTHKTIYMPTVERFKILLPPLSEQKRIADILDKADAIRRKRQQVLEFRSQFLKSTFLEMFGDPATNPKNLPLRELSEFYVSPKDGTKCGPFGGALKKEEYVSAGVPVWNMDNISDDGSLVPQIRLWISQEKYEDLSSYSVKDGDVIISRAGTVGKMCVVRAGLKDSIISTNLIRLRLNASLIPEFFVSLMVFFKGRAGRLKTGPDGAFTHMSTGVLDKLTFPYPSVGAQRNYVSIMEQMDRSTLRLTTAVNEADGLFNSLVQRAFKGEL